MGYFYDTLLLFFQAWHLKNNTIDIHCMEKLANIVREISCCVSQKKRKEKNAALKWMRTLINTKMFTD